MGEKTNIEWTDHTWNPWIGCSKVHTGCTNCYAETLMATRYGRVVWGPNGTRMLTSPANWAKPLKWNRDAEKAGVRARVFCASLADVFEDWGGQGVYNHKGQLVLESYLGDARDTFDGTIQEWNALNDKQAWHALELDTILIELFAVIRATPWLDWQVLTKRPQNVRRKIPFQGKWQNLWIGTSVSNQETADKQIPELLKLRDLAPVLFLSCEPLLGPISFRWAKWQPFGDSATDHLDGLRSLDWIIVGGESGGGARPCFFEWIDEIREQCEATNVPVFIKQMGADPRDISFHGLDVKANYRDKKGGDMDEWPEMLRVRQFPEVVVF